MKKIFILPLALMTGLIFNSCLFSDPIFIPTNKTLNNGVYLEKRYHAGSGSNQTIVIDGVPSYMPEGLDSAFYEYTLTVLPGRKIKYSTATVFYYDWLGEDAEDRKCYSTLNPPRVENFQEYSGNYVIGSGNRIKFYIDGHSSGGPLQSDAQWEYNLSGGKLTIDKRAIIDGGLHHEFVKQLLE